VRGRIEMNPVDIASDNQFAGVEELAVQLHAISRIRVPNLTDVAAPFSKSPRSPSACPAGAGQDEVTGVPPRARSAARDDAGQNSDTLGDILRGSRKRFLRSLVPRKRTTKSSGRWLFRQGTRYSFPLRPGTSGSSHGGASVQALFDLKSLRPIRAALRRATESPPGTDRGRGSKPHVFESPKHSIDLGVCAKPRAV
jgi:hypothetical protein